MQAADALFRSLDREIWAITSGTPQAAGGLLATWVMQATLAPCQPLLLAGLAPNHHTTQMIDSHGHLAAHLLRQDQTALGLQLASTSGHQVKKLAGVQLQPACTDWPAPVLADCLGWLAGPVVARLDAGDRIFFWIEIVAAKAPDEESPLRQSKLLAAADPSTRQRLQLDRESDIALHRPVHQHWRAHLPEHLKPFRRPDGSDK